MSRRTNARIDADKLRAAAVILRGYGVPAAANTAEVVADAIEAGTRKRVAGYHDGKAVEYPFNR